MKNYRFALISDAFFCAVTTLFFAKAMAAFFIKSNALAWAFSCVLAACAVSVFIFFKLRKNRALLLKESDRFYMTNVAKEFEIMPDNRLIDWFFNLFQKLNRFPVKSGDRIFLSENITVFFDFSEKFTREKLSSILKKADCLAENFCKNAAPEKIETTGESHDNNAARIVIFCNEAENEAKKLADETSESGVCEIYLAGIEYLFSLMKKVDYFYLPKIIAFKAKRSFLVKIKEECRRNFTKKRALTFLALGSVTLLFSSFTFFKKYYLIYSLICFTMAFVCLVFGKEQPSPTRTPPV